MEWAVCDCSATVGGQLKVAVTGASGFIGRHVLSCLLKGDGIDIVAVTRNAKHLKDFSQSLGIVEIDIAKAPLNCFAQLGGPDVLIHLAWDGLPNYKSLHHFESELPKQYVFLKQMINGGLPSLLVTGTCFEYGLQSGALGENTLTRPDNPYGYAKDALRRQLGFLKSTLSFNLTWARLFYMYGEGQPSNSLYPKLQEAVLRGDKVFNMSGGEQLRDYLPVGEVAKKLVDLAKNQQDRGVVNICSGKPMSIRKLVEQWVTENNWNIELNLGHYPYPDYEPMAFWGEQVGNS